MTTPISPDTPALPFPATKRARGRSLADFGELLPAEQKLLACSAKGECAGFGDGVPADASNPNTIVRADFLRFLVLGGDEQAPVHEQGVQLVGAWIDGKLDLGNCVVPHGITLLMCKFKAAFIVNHAHITGLLRLDGSHLLQGLNADGLRCDSGVFLGHGFHSFGLVRFLKAHIGTDIDCSGGQFEPTKGTVFAADGAVVRGVVRLTAAFKAAGTVRLLGTHIGGNLECSGGQFEPKEGDALIADGIGVRGFVHLNEGFKATGEVRFLGAQIGGSLVCSDGQFASKSRYALSADRAVIKGDVILKGKFTSTGTVVLNSSHIGGNLSCAGGQFQSQFQQLDALSADSMVVKGSVFLKSRFKAIGNVRLIGALVGGDLSCIDSVNITGELDLEGATIQGKLLLRNVLSPVRIDVSAAQIGELADDRSAWAKGSTLNGLVYKSLGGKAPTDAATRIKWLKLQCGEDLGEDEAKQGFRPQPWKQIQKVLREMGHVADAREVGVAYEDQLRKADRIGQITNVKNVNRWIPFLRRKCLRALHWLFGFLAGYGYHPLRLFMSLVGMWLFCGVIYWWLAYAPHSAIGPTDPLVFQNTAYSACAKENNGNWMLCEQLPAEYTTFSPLAYSLDILLPLVDLGQEKRWGPLIPTPENNFCVELLSLSPPHWVRLLNWFQILYGWIASLLFVAIVSGMSRRSEMDK